MKATRARKACDTRATIRETASRTAVYETMRLYHAWIGYLLTRLGERTVRVQVEDIRGAMDRFCCSVSREEDAYVIRLADSASCLEKEGMADDNPIDNRNGDIGQGGEHDGK